MAEDDKKEEAMSSEKQTEKSGEDASKAKKEEDANDGNGKKGAVEAVAVTAAPSITVSLLLFWIIPVLVLAVASRYVIDAKTPPKPNVPKNRPISINMGDAKTPSKPRKMTMKSNGPATAPSPTPTKSRQNTPRPSPLPSANSNWPTSYRETVETIQKRNRKIPRVGTTSSSSSTQEKKNSPGDKKTENSKSNSAGRRTDSAPGRDPVRKQYEDKIDDYRETYEADPDNVLKAIKLADALRLYDVTYHDGGTKQPEALKTYEKAIEMSMQKRKQMTENGEDPTVSLSQTSNVRGEVMMDYSQKSVDGLLCALYTAKGKVFFMANMFERAVETYSKCLEIEPLYLDALG